MFVKATLFVAFAFALHSATAQSDDAALVDFTKCMANPQNAAAYYDKQYEDFVKTCNANKQEITSVIQAELGKVQLSDACKKAFPNHNAEYYSGVVFRTCGGFTTDETVFKRKDGTPEATCAWLVTYSMQFMAHRARNEYTIEICNAAKVFSRFVKNFAACNAQ